MLFRICNRQGNVRLCCGNIIPPISLAYCTKSFVSYSRIIHGRWGSCPVCLSFKLGFRDQALTMSKLHHRNVWSLIIAAQGYGPGTLGQVGVRGCTVDNYLCPMALACQFGKVSYSGIDSFNAHSHPTRQEPLIFLFC